MADFPKPAMTEINPYLERQRDPYSGQIELHWYTADQLRDYAAAKVAEERERLIREVAALHMAQSVNNQNHPRAWHDGVDAALDAIRNTENP